MACQVVASTSMPELSSQAQEVFWAFNRAASGKPEEWHYLPAIAAALRAAADQVVPASPDMIPSLMMVRYRLLAIAAELEAQ
jgi:hypothetical protein